MEADLLPERLLVSSAVLAWMAEGAPPPPSAAVVQPLSGRDCHLEYWRGTLQVGCPPLLKPEWPWEHSDNATLKVPKLEHTTTNSYLPVAMESPSDLLRVTRKCLPLPSPFPSPAPPLSPPTLPLSFRSVNQRTLGSAARPTPRQLIPPSTRSRVKRKGISERLRLLAKLMPWDRKMDTGTMLAEARDYVRFLEAQVAALQCMPVQSRFGCPPPSSYAAAAPALRGLEGLTRQQLLHVLVRSPLVQDKLCALGLCVFAAEQVVLLQQEKQDGSTSTLSD